MEYIKGLFYIEYMFVIEKTMILSFFLEPLCFSFDFPLFISILCKILIKFFYDNESQKSLGN